MVISLTIDGNRKKEKVKIASCDDEQSAGWDLRDPPEAKEGL